MVNMCRDCKTKVDYLVNHVDEIIAKSNEDINKIIMNAYTLPRWKRILIRLWPSMFSFDELRGWGN